LSIIFFKIVDCQLSRNISFPFSLNFCPSNLWVSILKLQNNITFFFIYKLRAVKFNLSFIRDYCFSIFLSHPIQISFWQFHFYSIINLIQTIFFICAQLQSISMDFYNLIRMDIRIKNSKIYQNLLPFIFNLNSFHFRIDVISVWKASRWLTLLFISYFASYINIWQYWKISDTIDSLF
jgi:hypothetical protein